MKTKFRRTGMYTTVFLAILVLCLTARLRAIEPKRPGQENMLTRAVYSENQLWARSDAGQLYRISDKLREPVEVKLPHPALDLCLLRGSPAVISCGNKGCGAWDIRRWDGKQWMVEATVKSEQDELIALNCDTPSPSILTNRRFIEIGAAKPHSVKISEKINSGMVAAMHVTPDHVFVGVNAGEWGGGLQRIDRRDGKVNSIGYNATGELCGGPLNGSCDPVNAIVDEPGRPDCVLAAIGLVHFSPHGRIVEVCGKMVRRIYFKPYGIPPQNQKKRPKSDEPFETVAFFSLARDRDTLWAVGIDGIYKADKTDFKYFAPLPEFKKVGAFHVSFAIPGIILILTRLNQRRSISGSVPMLVTR